MRRAQRQTITGIVVNDHVNISRASYDELKAMLFNCLRRGPRAENRSNLHDFKAHLDGRVLWVERLNPRRGRKLRAMFESIEWPHDETR